MLRDLLLLSPLHLVGLTALTCLLASVVPVRGTRAFMGRMAATGFALAGLVVFYLWRHPELSLTHPSLAGSIAWGPATLFCWGVLLLIGFSVALIASDHLPEHDMDHGEFYALLALAIAGMMAMVAAREFFTLFIGLEIMSMSVYVLCGFNRKSVFSAEAAMKYFILGSFASAIFLLGIAFAYGLTGTTDIRDLGFALAQGLGGNPFAGISALLLLVGFAFKVAAVPFHTWTPDAYEGAPTPVTALMAAGVKLAAVVTFVRVFLTAFSGPGAADLALPWPHVVEVLALITIVYGNLAALKQFNVKRMLGYSAIAHAGYLLLGVAALPAFARPEGVSMSTNALGAALLYYLLGYALANIAAFGALSLLARKNRDDMDLLRLDGVARRHPALALVLAIALLSLAGIPPTAGFFGKFALLREVLFVRPDLLFLVVVAVLGSAVSAYYYLRPLIRMYMHEEREPVRILRSPGAWVALLAAGGLLLHAGLQPARYMRASSRAAADLALGARSSGPAGAEAPAAPTPWAFTTDLTTGRAGTPASR